MGTPYLIGDAQSAASTATLAIAVGTATGAGDAIIVAAANSGSTAVTSVTDSQGNSYAQQTSTTSEITSSVWAASGPTTALTTADTITVTFAAANTNSKTAVAAGVTGYAATDVTPAPASSAGSTTPAIASGALARAEEVIWFAFATGNGGGAPSGFTNCANLGTVTGSGAEYLSLAYAVVSTSASVTGSCTVASTKWAALALSLEAPLAPDTATRQVLLPPGPFLSPAAIPPAMFPPPALPGGGQPAPAPPRTTPYLIGDAQSAASTATLAIAVGTATGAGDAIIVAAANSGSTAVTSVTDSQGNSYARKSAASAQPVSSLWVADFSGNPHGTTALTTADTITVTWTAANSNSKTVVAGAVSGYSGTDTATTPASSAGSTTPAVAAGPMSQPGEVAFFAFATGNGGGAPSGFTNCANLGTVTGSGAEYLSLAWDFPPGTAAVTGSCTVASTKWTAQAITLLAATAPPSASRLPLIPPGPFTSPASFPPPPVAAGEAAGQPPAPPPPVTQAGTWDPSLARPPGPFLSPGNVPAALPPEPFYDGGQPRPLPPAPVVAPTTRLLAPGPFIAPGNEPAPIPAPPFYDDGQPAQAAGATLTSSSSLIAVTVTARPGPPAIPSFPAGYGPWPADFTQWITQSLGFCATGIAFRAQATSSQQFIAGGPYDVIAYDDILEDPYAGWNAASNRWTAPFTGFYQVTASVSVAAQAVDIQVGVFATGGAQQAVGSQASLPGGTLGGGSATAWLALAGGLDYVQAVAQPSADCSTDVSAPGRFPALEIAFLSL